ncbi:hypothetical protein IWX78_000782 [Mycetocola sp. CAN_C7]|uniref:hypothetical protein n=1 Tax=Mycetocola sp. CAN_C7 TaxID=2787724 RepID=UPI0018CBBE18
MPERFEWVPDVSRGEWLRPMEAEPFGSILSVVPPGFGAYARVFHPVDRDRPHVTKTWQGLDEYAFFEGDEDIESSLETELASWATASASFGTTVHAEAQYARLLRCDYGDAEVIAPDGWRYGSPPEGRIDAASLAAASAVLARHTTTPDAGVAAIWEGWGGLVSSAGVAYLTFEAVDEPDRGIIASLSDRIVARARRWSIRTRSRFLPRFRLFPREPEPGTGVLSAEAARGPRFDLHGDTGRHYVLFEAGANDFADAAWPESAPWVDQARWAQSPSILWPEDHAWVLATEIDFDSTLVAGSTELIRELMQTPGLEVLPIREDADLSWDGDRVNLLDA